MAKLTAKTRKALPQSDFGLPSEQKYPMPNKSHAANAKSRASQQFNAGKLSQSQLETIDSKADKLLGVADADTKARQKNSKVNGASRTPRS